MEKKRFLRFLKKEKFLYDPLAHIYTIIDSLICISVFDFEAIAYLHERSHLYERSQ